MSDNYNSDVYLRLLKLISLLTETEEGITINELSERLKVRQSTIINDLHNLQTIAEFNMSIGPADWELPEYWKDKDSEVREEEDNEFLLALYNGTRNDVPLRILYLKREEKFSVELTAFERMILGEFLKNHNMKEMIPDRKDIYVKNISKPDYSIYNKLALINEAIREKKVLEINGINEYSNKLQKLIVYPLRIATLFTNGEYYLVSVYDNDSFVFNVENIIKINITNRPYEVSSDLCNSIIEEYDYRWGTGVNEGIFDFELKIYNEADLFNRLSKRLSSRKYGVWENHGEYAIYKDKVIDYNALKQWVMSYGSSVKVIKPQRLASDILRSAEERLRRYETLIKR